MEAARDEEGRGRGGGLARLTVGARDEARARVPIRATDGVPPVASDGTVAGGEGHAQLTVGNREDGGEAADSHNGWRPPGSDAGVGVGCGFA